VGASLFVSFQGCTWLESLSVSEKGKERCLQEINGTSNSFVSELSFRKCLKGIEAILASEEKERLPIDKMLVINSASQLPVYTKRWEADIQRLNLALKYNTKSCEKSSENILESSLELNRSQCEKIGKNGAKPLKDSISTQCSMILEFQSWFEWAVLSNRQGPCEELMQNEINDK